VWRLKTWMQWMVGGWGIYSPNHQRSRWWRLLSHGAPDTVRCASHVTRPLGSDRWSFWQLGHWTVRWCTGQSLFTVRCAFWLCSDFCTHCSALTARCRWSLALCSRYSTGTPDSPVNYSGAAPWIPEGGKFGVGFPGAPDTVRWHTGQSGAPDQGTLRLSFALFIWTLFWSFYWFVVNLWHL
jgi:hypothetical protein